MNFDQYTERARGFVQSAQTLAIREGHQQFTPEHILKVLLDDPEGLAAGLIERSGGRARDALAATERVGAIDALIRESGEEPNPVCTECEGERKGQPIKGMNILWGLRQDGTEWSGGKILDPANGKTYRCYIEVVDGGKRLKVRGFVGFALLGRTQYWQRAE